MRKIVFILIVIYFGLQGCASSRKLTRIDSTGNIEPESENNIESVVRNNLSAQNFFIQKADISVNVNGHRDRFLASIKYKKPDTLLISVKTKTGIEAGRALMTSDNLIINDRINKKVLEGEPEKLGAKYGIDPGLIFVIFGDMIVKENDYKRIVNCSKGFSKETYIVNGRNIEYEIDCRRRKTVAAEYEGEIRTGNILLKYEEIIELENGKYPSKITVKDDMNSIEISVGIKKIIRPWDGKIAFVKGSGYKIQKIK